MSAQVFVLLGEAVGLAVGLLVLFRLRHRWGYVPVYVTVGAFQFLQVVLAKTVYVPIAEGMYVSPGSVIAFPATLVALLLLYIWEDARETRVLIYSLVLANLLVSLGAAAFGLHLEDEATKNILGLSPDFFSQNARVLIAGTAVLFVDCVLLILLFEAIRRVTGRNVFLRTFMALAIVLSLDTMLFMFLVFSTPSWDLMGASIIGKVGAAVVYATALALYVRFVEHPERRRGEASPDIGRLFRALTYKERFEKAQRMATTDGLTGLFNRAHFDDVLQTEWERARKSGKPLGLLLLDLDHFKEINDRFGHAVGDRVLHEFSQLVKRTARSSDVPCRYGGDELAVITPGADRRDAADFAERISRRLAERVQDEDASLPHFTITTGVASAPQDADSPSNLLDCADRRLLTGKRVGRGRVVSSDGAAE